jgi:poly(3-hydroxybutyrate) depolymerase
VLFYWHGTGGSPSEVEQGVPGATSGVRSNGGLVASFGDTNGKGDNTGNLVWYTGDIESADQILACAIQKGVVDTGRIYTAGYSAGGLQAGTMLLQRSQYIAAAIVYSGGPPLGGLVPGGTNFSDPSHIPAMIGAHGAQGSDWLALDFYDGTNLLGDTVKKAGGYAMDCDDGGDHAIAWISTRAGVGGQAMKFLQDHPYNTKPSPYASAVPAGFPRYCKNK